MLGEASPLKKCCVHLILHLLTLLWSNVISHALPVSPTVFTWGADSKLQWQIVIAIFELPSFHTREKNSQSLQFSILEGEKKHGLILCSSDMLIAISFEIEILFENAQFIGGSGQNVT